MASVKIPQIGPDSGPDFVPQERTTEVSPVGGAIRSFSDPLKQLGNIFAIQQQHSDALDTAQAVNDAHNRLEGARASIDASADPHVSAKQFADQADGIVKDITQQYAHNPRITDELALKLSALHNNAVTDVAVQAAKAADAEATNRTNVLLPQLANTAATSQDPVARQNAHDAAMGLIDRLPYEIQSAKRLEFDSKKTLTEGQFIASNSPGDAITYIRRHPELTPDQQTAIINRANAAYKAPLEAHEAQVAQVRAQKIQEYEKQMSAGHLDQAALAQDVVSGRITPEDASWISKVQFRYPSDKPTQDNFAAQTLAANSVEELDQIKANIQQTAAAPNPLLNGKDVPGMLAAVDSRKRFIGTDKHIATMAGEGQIERSYQGWVGGTDGDMYDSLAHQHHAPTRVELRENAKNMFHQLIANPDMPVSDYPKMVQAAILANQPTPGVQKKFEKIGVAPPIVGSGYATSVGEIYRKTGALPLPPGSKGTGTTAVAPAEKASTTDAGD